MSVVVKVLEGVLDVGDSLDYNFSNSPSLKQGLLSIAIGSIRSKVITYGSRKEKKKCNNRSRFVSVRTVT